MSDSIDDFYVWPKISEIVSQVASGSKSAKANVELSLQLIADKDNTYNAILSRCNELALQQAEAIDRLVREGKATAHSHPLLGVPFIVKDNLLVKGTETTAGSNMLKGFIAPYTATAVKKLEEAGAICVAKANLDAFAHGGSTENSDFGVTKNPHDSTRVPGGSSGGSAASVAIGYTPFALGTDTGGSIRQPASYCGVFGMKPTYGLVSRCGAVAMASSTDVVGPLTRNAEDASLVLSVMSGLDRLDSTTIESDPSLFLQKSTTKKLSIGVVKEMMGDGVAKEVRDAVNDAVEKLKQQGHSIKEVSIPTVNVALAVYYVVVPAELSSNLLRHDGQRYQFAVDDANSLEESYTKSRSKGFGKEAKRRIMLGTYVLSSGYYDAYYKKAQKARTKLIQEFEKAFGDVDFLIGPTAPTPAFKIGEHSGDPLEMYAQDIMTVSINLAGVPAVSVPLDTGDRLPIGIQIIGKRRQDAAVLTFAKQFSEGTGVVS